VNPTRLYFHLDLPRDPHAIRTEEMSQKTSHWVFWILFAVVYLIGFWPLNEWVREACAHESYIYAWTCEAALSQRIIALMYLGALPILAHVAWNRIWRR